MEPLVSPQWLNEHRDDEDLRIVDCRFVLGEPGAGHRLYLEGHIPGAAFMDLDTELAGRPGPAGRHPLPDPFTFTAAAQRAGISRESRVVAYDQAMAGGAARLWWLLRHFGHEEVAVLEGGIAGWDGHLTPGAEFIPEGGFRARPRRDDFVDRAEVLDSVGAAGTVIIDARAGERYRGEVEPIDPVAGRIPGARNLPYEDAFPAPEDLIATEERIIVYCGSGVTACVVLLALAAGGRTDAELYPGSWSEWSHHGLPAETGPGRGDG